MTGRRGKGGKGLSPSTLSKLLFLKELTWANITKMTGRRGKGGKGLSPSTLSKPLFLKELTWANICSFLRTTCYFNKTKRSLTICNQ